MCFKQSLRIYFGTFFSGIIFLIVIFTKFNGKPLLDSIITRNEDNLFLILIMWCIVVFFGGRVESTLRMKRMINILYNECNPEKYVDVINKHLNKRLIVEAHLVLFLIMLDTGYQAMDNYETSDMILERIKRNPRYLNRNVYKVAYLNNLVASYLKKGDMEKAESELVKIRTDLLNLKMTKKDKEKLSNGFCINKIIFDMCNGGVWDKAEETFNKRLINASNMLERVYANLYLAQIHIKNGNIEKAKEACEQVIKYGNKLHAVQTAKELLFEYCN